MQKYKRLHGRLRTAADLTDVADLRRALKRVRIYLGYSPTQLAAVVGVDRHTIIGLERNRTCSHYRPERATVLGLMAFCKRPLPDKATKRAKRAVRNLTEVVTRIATEHGRAEYYRDRDRDAVRRPKARPVLAGPTHRTFLLDDLDDYDDADLRTPEQVECDNLLSHIRLNADPDEYRYVRSDKREALRGAIWQLRDKLNLTQSLMREDHGISRPTISRLENLDRDGAALPSRSTCLKLAAICHREGRTEDRLAEGMPLDTEWHQLATILEDAATWERRNRFAPRGKNRRYHLS